MRAAQLLSLLALGAGGLFSTACGDGPQCPSDLVLVIQSPADGASISASADLDANAAGLQTNVDVRSNFNSGAELTLTVTDDISGAVSQHNAMVNGDGDATFASVTLPGGPLTLDVEGTSKCGLATDSSSITVVTDGSCALTIDEGPIVNDFYAPIPVLNSTNDSNLTLPNFQANVTVAAAPGFSVEFFVLDIEANSEASVGTMTADASGVAKFQTTLAQGKQVLRATCSLGSINAQSASNTVQVDTVVPTCAITDPVAGVTVTPDDDEDGNDTNGIQMTWTATVNDAGDGDIVGEAASFSRDTTEFVASALDASGNTSTALGEFTAPGAYEMALNSQDHAGNLCTGSDFTANVVMSGCAIAIQQPSGAGTTNGVITADSDGVAVNGLQADITVQVGTECAGQTVFVDCGPGEISAVAPANGTTVIPDVTMNVSAVSEGNATCVARVVSTDSFQTSNQAVIPYDTQAPSGTLSFTFPSGLTCGDTILRDVSNDSTGTLADGFQIEMRVTAPLAASRDISVTNGSVCTTPCITAAPAGDVVVDIDIADGPNDIRAVVRDDVGNEATSGECIIRLEDIAVDIVDPVGSGLLGANSPGVTVNGGNAETTVCATVSRMDVNVSLEVVSGAGTTTVPMTFNAGLNQFCTGTQVFPEGAYQLTATAIQIAGTLQGTDFVNLTVDLTPPTVPGGFTFDADAANHREIDATWSAAAGVDHFVLKFSTTAFTANFANEGTEVAGVGLSTSATIPNLDTSTDYFVGLALADAAGNLSAAQTLGAIRPEFDPTGALIADLATANPFPRRFGFSVVSGNFNNDAFSDIAVSAMHKTTGSTADGEVYIYFGSASGIGTTPDVTITATAISGRFGQAMARLNWSGGAADGLAISSPFTNQVFVFHGATIAGSTTLDSSDADVTIGVDAAANWFTNGFVGWSMASGELNSAASADDLIIGVPTGNGGVGGVVIIYGGTPTGTTITLSQGANATAMAGLEGHIFQNPVAAANASALGYSVAYLGDTRAGDGVGDLAVTYFANTSPQISQDDNVYVLRGRTPSGTSGISFITLGANDLVVQNPTAEASTAYGMELSSIDDQNGDGFRDLVITAHEQGRGELWIVSGSLTGSLTLDDSTDYLSKISGAVASGVRFAAGTANGADSPGSDVNGDGREDLVVAGGTPGSTTGVSFFVWYGGRIPVGDALATTANSIISAPTEFTNNARGGLANTLQVTWAGDVNNDGLEDLCWSDWQAGVAAETEGRFEVLWDDPTN